MVVKRTCMFHLITITTPSDLLAVKDVFEPYDVIQLYKTSHPKYTHVIFTNTWHAKHHRMDVMMEQLNPGVARYMLELAAKTCVDMHEIEEFYDDTLIDLAYREFWSIEEDGKVYGVDYWGERHPYYNPNQPGRPQFPDIGELEVRRSVASLLKPRKNQPRKVSIVRPSRIKWDE